VRFRQKNAASGNNAGDGRYSGIMKSALPTSILALTFAVVLNAQYGPTGSVEFLVIDESGKALEGWKVSSFKRRGQEEAGRFKLRVAVNDHIGIERDN